MSLRPLLAAALTIVLLLPSAVAFAITAHLALEHAADHDRAAGGEASHEAMIAVAEHGHSHAATDPAHQHAAAGGQDEATGGRAAAPLLFADLAAAASSAAADYAGVSASSRGTPPGADLVPAICGPPLLALLSILRI